MAGLGYRNWSAGDVPTADQFDRYLQEQVVGVYTDTADRDTQLSVVKAEGMFAILLDTNTLTVYTGSAWSTVGVIYGALKSWTPTVTQSGSVTVTNTSSTYQRIGRLVTCRFQLAVTGSGSASNAVIIGGLPFAASATTGAIGVAYLFDSSAPATYLAHIAFASSSTLSLLSVNSSASDNRLGVVIFTAGLASSDTITGTFTYEAGSDA